MALLSQGFSCRCFHLQLHGPVSWQGFPVVTAMEVRFMASGDMLTGSG